MIIYEYKCLACNHTFDRRLSMIDHALPTTEPCPNCQEHKVEQTYGAPVFIDPVRLGVKKAPADFQKYVLGRIQHSVPGNVIGKGRSLVREI